MNIAVAILVTVAAGVCVYVLWSVREEIELD
jgi:hypothetical protein